MKKSIELYFDFNQAIIDNMRELKIDEVDAVILIIINRLLKMNKKIISPDNLKKYLIIPPEEIDRRMAYLMDNNYLTLESYKQDYLISNNNLIKILLELLTKENKSGKDDKNDYYSIFEEELGRPLNSIELGIIDSWMENKYSKEDIFEAWCIAVSKKNKSLQYTDGILLKKQLK